MGLLNRTFHSILLIAAVNLSVGSAHANPVCEGLFFTRQATPQQTWNSAREIKAQLSQIPIQDRMSLSIPYFARQVRDTMEIARGLRASGVNFTMLAATNPKLAELAQTFAWLDGVLQSAEETGQSLINENRLTMIDVTMFMLQVDLARATHTRLQESASTRAEWTRLRAVIGENWVSVLTAEGTLERQIDEGFILLPTLDETPTEVFSGTWPRVRPIGFSRTTRVTYDDQVNALSIDLPIHDIGAHQLFSRASETAFRFYEKFEAGLLAKVQAQQPEKLAFAKTALFWITHESFGEFTSLIRNYGDLPSARREAWHVEAMSAEFEKSLDVNLFGKFINDEPNAALHMRPAQRREWLGDLMPLVSQALTETAASL